jgi:hypothetical protein
MADVIVGLRHLQPAQESLAQVQVGLELSAVNMEQPVRAVKVSA